MAENINENEQPNVNKKAKKTKKKLNKKTKRNIYIVIGLVIAILITSYLLVRAYANHYKQKYLNEPISVLFMGMDGGSSEFADRDAMYADSMMGMSYNPDRNHMEMLSIPRDIYTQIACKEGDSQGEKINSAYMYGNLVGNGIGCMKDTIKYTTGMEFNRYIRVDFESVMKIVDLTGPVTITAINGTKGVEFCEQNQFGSSSSFCWTEGQSYQMGGEELLAYVRHRKTDSTVYREKRSQQVMEQMIIKMVGLELTGQQKKVKQAYALIDSDMKYEEVKALALNFVTFPSINKAQLATSGIADLNMPNSQVLLTDGTNELLVAAYMKNFTSSEFTFSFSDVVFVTNADRFNPNDGYIRQDEPPETPVEEKPVEKPEETLTLSLSGNTVIDIGAMTQLIAALSDPTATISTINYVSSNPQVATVTAQGQVSGVSAGSATISASVTTSTGKTVTASITITVNEKQDVVDPVAQN